ncbi:MAG: cupin domain-containing protein [Bacteroidota bacterium]
MNKIITVNSTQGQFLKIAGGEYRIIVSGAQTNGSFAVIEMSVPPGAGPIPHSHTDFEESFYVLEGEVSFKSENGSYTAQKDSFVSIPKGGIIHNFKNLTNKPAKLLCTVIPAGLDDFFKEVTSFMESIKDKTTKSDFEIKEEISRIGEKYGQKFYAPDILD